MSMQDIKDTFYTTVRDRIAAANPARTVVLRGVIRPAVLVLENELPTATMPDTFNLRWTALRVDPLGMIAATCEIVYASDGTTGAAGMDRGRALAAMDGELRTALATTPQGAPLVSIAEPTGGGAATEAATGTRIFWADPVFAPATISAERLARTATVEVFGYE